jgi:hypothetical protein
MPNRDNLVPFTSDQSREEAIRNGRKGGKASGKARRKKANLKKTIETLLALELPDSKLKDQLEEMGVDPTMGQGLVMSALLKGIQRGDPKVIELFAKLMQQTASPADKKEQKARTERMKAETEKIKAETARKDGTADKEHAHSQTVAIAEMINNPEAERVLEDFMAPRKEGEGE